MEVTNDKKNTVMDKMEFDVFREYFKGGDLNAVKECANLSDRLGTETLNSICETSNNRHEERMYIIKILDRELQREDITPEERSEIRKQLADCDRRGAQEGSEEITHKKQVGGGALYTGISAVVLVSGGVLLLATGKVNPSTLGKIASRFIA